MGWWVCVCVCVCVCSEAHLSHCVRCVWDSGCVCVCVCVCVQGVMWGCSLDVGWSPTSQTPSSHHQPLHPQPSLAACPSPGPRVCHVNPSLSRYTLDHTHTHTHTHTRTHINHVYKCSDDHSRELSSIFGGVFAFLQRVRWEDWCHLRIRSWA